MKRPSFQFYPSYLLRDTALRSCSAGARGLWIDMICFMHECNPYGYLKVGDKVIHADNLARMVGESVEVVQGWLDELQIAAVFDVDDGVICSRRMIRDEELRQKRSEGGKLGGNPLLKVNHKVKQEDKQNPTPSSSSSSSPSGLIDRDKEKGPAKSPTLDEAKMHGQRIGMAEEQQSAGTQHAVEVVAHALGAGLGSLAGAAQAYNPQSAQAFMNPYQQQVVDATMANLAALNAQNPNKNAGKNPNQD